MKIKITVVGSGYVGMSLSVLLAQRNDVTILDIDQDRVDKINKSQSTVYDKEIQLFLSEKSLSLSATKDKEKAYQDASYITDVKKAVDDYVKKKSLSLRVIEGKFAVIDI